MKDEQKQRKWKKEGQMEPWTERALMLDHAKNCRGKMMCTWQNLGNNENALPPKPSGPHKTKTCIHRTRNVFHTQSKQHIRYNSIYQAYIEHVLKRRELEAPGRRAVQTAPHRFSKLEFHIIMKTTVIAAENAYPETFKTYI